MYRHLLVPIDGSELSGETIGRAVEFARDADARITFFHAIGDYGVTGDGALYRTISPEFFAIESAGKMRAMLSDAEATARAAGVSCNSLSKISDAPHEAILDAAWQEGCDLIFMASHGPKNIGGLLLGSETLKVLVNSTLPVLVASVARNVQSSAHKKAIAVTQDDHSSQRSFFSGDKMDSKNIERMFASIDAMRVEEILSFFSEDICFQFGNNEPARGKDAVRQCISTFFSSIKAMHHTFTGVWAQGDHVICRSVVDYTRTDGKVVALPCVSILTYQGLLINDYGVYIDISPVFS